jgi:hypothetical protein
MAVQGSCGYLRTLVTDQRFERPRITGELGDQFSGSSTDSVIVPDPLYCLVPGGGHLTKIVQLRTQLGFYCLMQSPLVARVHIHLQLRQNSPDQLVQEADHAGFDSGTAKAQEDKVGACAPSASRSLWFCSNVLAVCK